MSFYHFLRIYSPRVRLEGAYSSILRRQGKKRDGKKGRGLESIFSSSLMHPLTEKSSNASPVELGRITRQSTNEKETHKSFSAFKTEERLTEDHTSQKRLLHLTCGYCASRRLKELRRPEIVIACMKYGATSLHDGILQAPFYMCTPPLDERNL